MDKTVLNKLLGRVKQLDSKTLTMPKSPTVNAISGKVNGILQAMKDANKEEPKEEDNPDDN